MPPKVGWGYPVLMCACLHACKSVRVPAGCAFTCLSFACNIHMCSSSAFDRQGSDAQQTQHTHADRCRASKSRPGSYSYCPSCGTLLACFLAVVHEGLRCLDGRCSSIKTFVRSRNALVCCVRVVDRCLLCVTLTLRGALAGEDGLHALLSDMTASEVMAVPGDAIDCVCGGVRHAPAQVWGR